MCALAFLSGCEKEPTMFEKCFDAEKRKLEALTDEVLYSRFGYSPSLHQLIGKFSDQYFALDVELLVSLEEQRRVEWARARERQMQNPLYQKYKKLSDEHRQNECCGEEWSESFDAKNDAEKACKADASCEVWVYDDPALVELRDANPEDQLWNSLANDVDALMADRDWSAVLGKDHQPEEYMEGEFFYHFAAHPPELSSGEELALSEMSADEAVRTLRAIYGSWLDHWVNEFNAKSDSFFGQVDPIARQTCNTRGLYE